MATVLAIPDLHAPCIHAKAFDFVKSLADEYQPDRVVFLGDAYDFAAASYHQQAAELPCVVTEWEEAQRQLQPFFEFFGSGKVDFLIGNHDALLARRATDSGLPEKWLRPPRELFGMPKNWKITERFGTVVIDGVAYRHGDAGPGGQFPALAHAKQNFQSTVLGHFHQAFGVQWYVNRNMRVFGCCAGSLADSDHLAHAYGRKFNRKPILGAAIIQDGMHCFCEVLPIKNKGVR